MYNKDTKDRIVAISVCEEGLFYTTVSEVCRLNWRTDTLTRQSFDVADAQILAVNRTEVLVCSPKKATYVRFES